MGIGEELCHSIRKLASTVIKKETMHAAGVTRNVQVILLAARLQFHALLQVSTTMDMKGMLVENADNVFNGLKCV